jgi:LEA14-like dessication related protein
MKLSLRSVLLSATLVLGAFLTACSPGARELAGLAVSVDGIESINSHNGQTEVVVNVRYHNETLQPIGIKSMTVSLYIDGIAVGKADAHHALGTRAMSSSVQPTTFVLTDAAIADQLRSAFAKGSVSYRVESTLTVISGENELRAKPNASGTLDLSGLKFLLN